MHEDQIQRRFAPRFALAGETPLTLTFLLNHFASIRKFKVWIESQPRFHHGSSRPDPGRIAHARQPGAIERAENPVWTRHDPGGYHAAQGTGRGCINGSAS